MKKIAIDITALSDQYKSRGIGVYTLNLVKRLIKSKKYEWHLIGFEDDKERFKADNIIFHSLGKTTASSIRNIFAFRSKYLPIITQIKPDLYFAPHFERGLPIGLVKTAVTLHDVSPYLQNKYSSKGFIINYLKGIFYRYNLDKAKQADLILTDSNFIRKELVNVGISEKKIKVTYLALSDDFDLNILKSVADRASVLSMFNITKPYIFYYGGLESNKNVDTLIKAFHLAKKKEKASNLKLVLLDRKLSRKGEGIVADSLNAQVIKDLIEKLDLSSDVILPKYINWKHLPIIDAEAEVFVHLSCYEGFGLAVLEAMAAGCPVIAAERSCYPEVFGNAVIFVNPDSKEEVSSKILELVNNKKLQKKYSQKGIMQARKYRWGKCAKATQDAFGELLIKR